MSKGIFSRHWRKKSSSEYASFKKIRGWCDKFAGVLAVNGKLTEEEELRFVGQGLEYGGCITDYRMLED